MQSVASTYPEKPSRNMVPRVFAVLALIIVGVVVYAVVSQGLNDSNSGSGTTTTTQTHAQTGPKNDYYVVKAGDSFTSIAQSQGISQEAIKKLNPNLDPQQLQPENCVDLVPNGCKQLANGG
jgi:LysM repeat protein